ncbi:MAG: GTP 3',8-cyclase 1 [Acidimicrobiia bacterium]
MLLDTLGRPLRSLRLSVTDRCNLRCHYCMPEEDYLWLPRQDLLSFEEMSQLVDLFGEMGVDRLRITGGEPLLRRDLPSLVASLASKPWVTDLAMTTNGIMLADAVEELKSAGLHRITVSLDTLQPERFQAITRRDGLSAVLAGIEAVRSAGMRDLKLDTVITRGVNDDELTDLIEFGREVQAEVRFIEYMDVGGATHWRPEAVVSRTEMLERLSARYGAITSLQNTSSAPADRFQLPDGTSFGIISSTTQPFCRTCDRARLTADGVLLLCLYAQHGTDLRRPLRAGASADTMRSLIRAVWKGRADRGAEERRGTRERGSYIPLSLLKRDAHLEMHTRGG